MVRKHRFGCPSKVLYLAMVKGYYTSVPFDGKKFSPNIIFFVRRPILISTIDGYFLMANKIGDEEGNVVFLNDYKKTWWLNKDKSK